MRAHIRANWRMYISAKHTVMPYMQPAIKPSLLERAWIRIFG